MDKQQEKAFRIAYLVAGFIKENLTETEHAELDDWVNENAGNQHLFEKWIDPENIEEWKHFRDKLDLDAKYERLKSRIDFNEQKQKSKIGSASPWLIAAALLLAILIPYYMFRNKDAIVVKPAVAAATDIAPGTNRATLTLSDNSVIVLDGMHEKRITRQGNTDVLKQDTEMIAYKPTVSIPMSAATGYNTLTTPAGGKFKVLLPDGSLVWLNAISSLKYPVAFTGTERRVELTGEGYFEVAKDAAHPFIVDANHTTVRVLGTHFNINAYTDEPILKVTLSEGSVKVNDSKVIEPGEQAQVNYSPSGIGPDWSYRVIEHADLETELAWQKGMFVFKETALDEIMRQVARWYDADIKYENKPILHLNAEINRNTPVSKLLHLLEGPGRVHFKIENKKITVMK